MSDNSAKNTFYVHFKTKFEWKLSKKALGSKFIYWEVHGIWKSEGIKMKRN